MVGLVHVEYLVWQGLVELVESQESRELMEL
jgi:hypothetical protein